MRLKILLLVCLVAKVYSDDREEEPELGVQPAIISGKQAHPGQFPHLVSVQSRTTHHHHHHQTHHHHHHQTHHHHEGHIERHECGGAIVDAQWILTAGHCYHSGETLIIKAGKHDITKNESNAQVVLVKKVIIHKDFNRDTLDNDIALLLLEHPLTLNQHVAKINLPAHDSEVTGFGSLSGWGTTDPHKDTEKSPILHTLILAILDRNLCNTLAENVKHSFSHTQFCAKGHPPGAGGCSGDSGGPFVVEKHGGHKEVVGIFSWAVSPCGTRDAMDAFTKVSAYVHWIHKVMGHHK